MKKLISLLSGLVLISIQACFAAPVMMGIELELQGITYENTSGAILMDHIRLFESDKKDIKENSRTKGQPNWYLEVDGPGNIEFVSRPMELTIEKELLELSLKEMNQLMSFILSKSKLIEAPNESYFLFDFEIKEETVLNKLGPLGTFVHWKPIQKGGYENIKTKIQIKIVDPFCVVRPQATFQLPLSKMQNFVRYMATCHKYLSAVTKEINKIFKNSLKISTPGEGLAHLVMITSELLKSNYSERELGPKGILTLMSRTPFSEMYEQLDKENKTAYHNLVNIYAGNSNCENGLFTFQLPLFLQPYALFCGGEDITKSINDILTEIGKYISKITIGDFLDSIVLPTKNKMLFEQANILLEKTLLQKEEEMEKILSKDPSNKEATDSKASIVMVLQDIKNGLFTPKGTDLLSPPVFLPHTYSLGKYKDIPPDTTIIEMRGYTSQYGDEIKMGPLAFLWLQREIENATNLWEKETFPWPLYREKSKPVEKKYQELDTFINNEYIIDTLGWFNKGKIVKTKLSKISMINYNDFFKILNETHDCFLAELEKNKLPFLTKGLEEKRGFVVNYIIK